MTSESSAKRPVLLTCAQPTGRLTLGNFLGALRNWAVMQDDYECYFGIVDQHAITVPYTPAELRRSTLSTLAQYLACGMDPDRSALFVQSHVTGHSELAWILGCLTPIGDLQRMTQFKEKAARLGFQLREDGALRTSHEGARQGAMLNAGLLFYPVLMAADILLYNADRVPVGDDQRQHLELCRDLAHRFNQTYSPTFTVPEAFIGTEAARIRSLQDPERKMSKSDPVGTATLFILDEPDVLRKKIMSAVTDSGTAIAYDWARPGVANLLQILAASSGLPVDGWVDTLAGRGYADLKRETADAVIAMLEPVRSRYVELMEDRAHLEAVLERGAGAAGRRAARTLSKVYRKVGYLQAPGR